MIEVGNTIEIKTTFGNFVDRYWSGQGEIVVDGNTYSSSPGVVEINKLVVKSGDQDRKMAIIVRANKPAILKRYINDIGPAVVTIRWAYRQMGKEWKFIPHLFEGQLSGYTLGNGTITFNLETFVGDIHTNIPRVMSHETQQALFPNDKGFTYLKNLATKGIETGWPN